MTLHFKKCFLDISKLFRIPFAKLVAGKNQQYQRIVFFFQISSLLCVNKCNILYFIWDMYLKSVTYLHAIFCKILSFQHRFIIYWKKKSFILLHVLMKSTHIRTDCYMKIHRPPAEFNRLSTLCESPASKPPKACEWCCRLIYQNKFWRYLHSNYIKQIHFIQVKVLNPMLIFHWLSVLLNTYISGIYVYIIQGFGHFFYLLSEINQNCIVVVRIFLKHSLVKTSLKSILFRT